MEGAGRRKGAHARALPCTMQCQAGHNVRARVCVFVRVRVCVGGRVKGRVARGKEHGYAQQGAVHGVQRNEGEGCCEFVARLSLEGGRKVP